MTIEDIKKLAENIVHYSIGVKYGEIIQIRYKNIECKKLVLELIKLIHETGAIAIPQYEDAEITSLLRNTYKSDVIDSLANMITNEADNFDSYISIQYCDNSVRLGTNDAYKDLLKKLTAYNKKVRDKKSIVVYYPSKYDAEKNKMDYNEYNKYVFDVLNYNYSNLETGMRALKDLFDKTKSVHISGFDTELSFAIDGIDAVILDGRTNSPDGEVYTAPLIESLNGYVRFNTSSYYMGYIFNNIFLEFKNGKVVSYDCNDVKRFEEIINIDKGSKYVGEFGIGVNPMIINPILNTLFDEKIYGSFHLALGQSYKNAYNGNDSNNHWDLIKIDREEYGGGLLFLDDVLVRENGEFITEDLKGLNSNKSLEMKRR